MCRFLGQALVTYICHCRELASMKVYSVAIFFLKGNCIPAWKAVQIRGNHPEVSEYGEGEGLLDRPAPAPLSAPGQHLQEPAAAGQRAVADGGGGAPGARVPGGWAQLIPHRRRLKLQPRARYQPQGLLSYRGWHRWPGPGGEYLWNHCIIQVEENKLKILS